MRAVLMSVNKPNTDNIHAGIKTSELRTKPPEISTPFKVYMYETLKGGGCGKVVSEWVCTDIKEWRMCMGVPSHLSKVACVSNEYIWKYCDKGEKNIGEMVISNLVIYDNPKELSEFKKVGFLPEEKWLAALYPNTHCHYEAWAKKFDIKRPPQSWCYVEETEGEPDE